MSSSTFKGDGFTLEIRRNDETAWTRGHHVLKAEWSSTDAAGHAHSSLELLDWVVTGSYWCDSCRDDHEEGEYRCRLCGETVEPAYVFTGPRAFTVPGLVEATLTMDDYRVFRLRSDELTMPWPPSPEWLARVTSREPDDFRPTFSRT